MCMHEALSCMYACMQALRESSEGSVLTAKLKLPLRSGVGATHRIVVSPEQFSSLHETIVN